MGFVDLHVHTTASDGTFTPSEVVDYGRKKQLSVIAITDHDTISGIQEAVEKASKTKDIAIVPGVEISCLYENTEIHMLGLFLDWNDAAFSRRLSDMRSRREERNEKIMKKMQEDQIPVTLEKLQFGEKDTVVTRAHFARFLEAEGYVKSKQEAFEKYMGVGCPYYIPREYIRPEEAISWIHEAGGLAFLAHPYLYGFSEAKVKNTLQILKEEGMDGVEAYHSSVGMGQTNLLRQYAAKLDLLVSGGSDFHGDNKPDVDLGCGRGGLLVTDAVYEKIRAKAIK
jgi:predicted metal-dependent phosphoesterase TrpH